MSIKLSIIIPIYNREAYIDRCVNSFINQLNDQTEVIFVLNACTDNSEAEVNKYKDQIKNIKIINSPTKGAVHARDLGLQNAEGEYVALIDIDDTVAPNYIEAIFDMFKNYPKCDYFMFDLYDEFLDNYDDMPFYARPDNKNDSAIKDSNLQYCHLCKADEGKYSKQKINEIFKPHMFYV